MSPLFEIVAFALSVERHMFRWMTLNLSVNSRGSLSENKPSVYTGFISNLMLSKDKLTAIFLVWCTCGFTRAGWGKGVVFGILYMKKVFLDCAKIITIVFVFPASQGSQNALTLISRHHWITRKHFQLKIWIKCFLEACRKILILDNLEFIIHYMVSQIILPQV